jgi:hypothetical protein
MNPSLSRRVAKVIDILVALGLSIDDRFAFAYRVEHAEDFSSLPEADRRSILAAEKIAQAGLSMADIMNLAREQLKEDN